MKVALIGNQNCGKTTLFNRLTGGRGHVGNFPGVTVEKKEGLIRGVKDANLVDLPGIYSLSPYSKEEIVTRDFLLEDKPDVIINLLDATNLERNLYLTLQLSQLKIPMIVVLNFMDEVESSNNILDPDALEDVLGIPIIPISAYKGDGVEDIIERLQEPIEPNSLDICDGGRNPDRFRHNPSRLVDAGAEVHKAIHSIAHIIEDHANENNIPVRFASMMMASGDKLMAKKLKLHKSELDLVEAVVCSMEKETGQDRTPAIINSLYDFIEDTAKLVLKKVDATAEQKRSLKIDKILTNKYLGLPIFLCIMLAIFALTFNYIGGTLSYYWKILINNGIAYINTSLAGSNSFLHSLIVDGLLRGVGSVLGFFPIILTLFFLLSLLEDSGYMARVAFIMDKLLRFLGLSGRSFIPMLLGFGCSVPAIMATRTLPSQRDRRLTMFLIPFMSCNAKIPVYTLFVAVFLPTHAAIIMGGLYLLGVIAAIFVCFLFKNTIYKGTSTPFIMELPPYRLPSMKNTILHMWERAKDFLVRAFTLIVLASLIIWFMQSFTFSLNTANNANSMLAIVANFITPIFKPLGFASWINTAALATGLIAKEAVVSTIGVLTNGAPLSHFFTTASALSFLTFTLIYPPCVAAIATLARELNNKKLTIAFLLFQTAIAWLLAFIVYQLAMAKFIDIILVLLLIALVLWIIYMFSNKKNSCTDCSNCPKCDDCS